VFTNYVPRTLSISSCDTESSDAFPYLDVKGNVFRLQTTLLFPMNSFTELTVEFTKRTVVCLSAQIALCSRLDYLRDCDTSFQEL
jgi:hypothetical protein